ncbi:MAG: hypothetical protein AAF938_20790 [Myxococcota bacterium]
MVMLAGCTATLDFRVDGGADADADASDLTRDVGADDVGAESGADAAADAVEDTPRQDGTVDAPEDAPVFSECETACSDQASSCTLFNPSLCLETCNAAAPIQRSAFVTCTEGFDGGNCNFTNRASCFAVLTNGQPEELGCVDACDPFVSCALSGSPLMQCELRCAIRLPEDNAAFTECMNLDEDCERKERCFLDAG